MQDRRPTGGRVIVKTSLADQATAWMREKITGGQWPVGGRIPAEQELAALTGLGRNTVREAVRALTYAGLLETRQGEGTFVHSANEVEAALRRRADRAAERHVNQVRRGLETEAARLAAAHRTPQDLVRLDAAFARRTAARAAGGDAFVEADLGFHLAVVEAAHNPVLAEIYASLTGRVACTLRAGMRDEEGMRRNDVWHAGILRAVRAGDPAAAARAACDNHTANLAALDGRPGEDA
jgi:DNA-binding FadR family transcriptional regulator